MDILLKKVLKPVLKKVLKKVNSRKKAFKSNELKKVKFNGHFTQKRTKKKFTQKSEFNKKKKWS